MSIDIDRVYARVIKAKGRSGYTYECFYECPHCGQYVQVVKPSGEYQSFGAAQEAATAALAKYKERVLAETSPPDRNAPVKPTTKK